MILADADDAWTPIKVEGTKMLFWTWFAVAALFGIAIAADIIGNGPLAYLGGLLTGAAYILASKLTPKYDEGLEGDEAPRAPAADRNVATPPPIPPEF
jgi:hypothetical protein